jgi:hypothetical protein
VKVGGMPWPRKRRSSYLVQWFSMTKEVQINELVVYGVSAITKLYGLTALDHMISPCELFVLK